MSEMIDRVARALQRWGFENGEEADEVWNDDYEPDAYKEAYRRQARAAIEAMKEPTDAMVGAGVEGWKANGYMSIQWVWPSMVDEALR